MLSVTKIFKFEAAHHLPFYSGACHHFHGHSYKLEVTVTGDLVFDTNKSSYGMIMDFKELKSIVNHAAVSKYDHSDLNEYFDNPTAENMVKKIALDIIKDLPKGVILKSCKLWETDTSYAEWSVTGGAR